MLKSPLARLARGRLFRINDEGVTPPEEILASEPSEAERFPGKACPSGVDFWSMTEGVTPPGKRSASEPSEAERFPGKACPSGVDFWSMTEGVTPPGKRSASEQPGGAHSAAYTHSYDSVLTTAPFQFIQRSRCQLRTGTPEWMT